MSDIAAITSVLSNLKRASEILGLLRVVDVSFDRAELKIRVADLADAVVDARVKTIEFQEAMQEKDVRIAALEDALEIKAS
jgi:hypothetical protein